MKNAKKVTAVVITAVAITGSASALANAAGVKAKSVSNTKTSVTQIHMNNGIGNMGDMRGPGGHLTTVLADLVAKGTITAAQSKAITDALAAAEAAEQANRPADGPMGRGFMNSNKEAVITTTLGIDATTLRTRLAAGDSLATIAGAKKDALIAALVADVTKQIDAAVTAGKLTAAQAATLKSGLTAHITAEVNETRPMGMGGKGGHGPRGNGMGLPNGTTNGIPSTTTTTSSN